MAYTTEGATLSPAILSNYGNYAIQQQQQKKKTAALPQSNFSSQVTYSPQGLGPGPGSPSPNPISVAPQAAPTPYSYPGTPAQAATAAQPPPPYDPKNDPVLQQLAALQGAQYGEMGQQTNDIVRQSLLATGSRDLAMKYFSQGDPILDQISEDPWTGTSLLAKENYNRIQNVAGISNDAARNNYFFGSARTQGITDAERTSLFNRTGIIGDATSKIQTAYQQLAQFRMQQELARLQQMNLDYSNYIQNPPPGTPGTEAVAGVPAQVSPSAQTYVNVNPGGYAQLVARSQALNKQYGLG